ncbi:homolog of yeast CDT1 A [Striga asiatica]|uniref:Homolog of yeast CDT1 A n=1 Tax=Striga asiatica TaxID=4170 RepID=A0A5A7QW75_STRAF|nr:homolog of yeast CDT1 A [Striga asiatica]
MPQPPPGPRLTPPPHPLLLNAEATQSKSTSQSLSENLWLRKVFRSRLLDFLKSHTGITFTLLPLVALLLKVLVSIPIIENLMCESGSATRRWRDQRSKCYFSTVWKLKIWHARSQLIQTSSSYNRFYSPSICCYK